MYSADAAAIERRFEPSDSGAESTWRDHERSAAHTTGTASIEVVAAVVSVALSGRLTLGVVLAVGIVTPGLADYLLSSSGYPGAGALVWASGYAATILVVWYGWIRPLDLRGPAG